jgi:hypothetical protein
METNIFLVKQSWSDFPSILTRVLSETPYGSTIVEIGAGANPLLTEKQASGYKYIVIDSSAEELSKARGIHFERICADICKTDLDIQCELIITRMVLEHIQTPAGFHTACYKLLKRKGTALHFFATKYSPASIVNLTIPDAISKYLLYAIQKRNWLCEGKFKAYYRWTLGPVQKQINRLENLGFEIVLYYGYTGSGYLTNVFFFRKIEHLYNRLAIKIRSPWLCSNAILILKK